MSTTARVRNDAHARRKVHRLRWSLAASAVVVAVTATLGQASGAAATERPTPFSPTTSNVLTEVAAPAAPPAAPAAPAAATVAVTPPTAPVACRKGVVALTFDDGPAKVVTDRLLGILEQHHVPATFFMVGSRIHSAPGVALDVQRAGFQIGNHTWDHADLTTKSKKGIRAEIDKTATQLEKAGVTPGPIMRPPYGAINGRVRKVMRKLGLTPVLWTVDSNDWRGKPRKGIVRGVLAQLRPHEPNVVLQHDGVTNSPASVAAVPTIIRKARERGYCFGTIGSDGRPHAPVPVLVAQANGASEAGPTPATIELTLSEPTSRPVSVHLTTAAGTAQPGADFSPLDVTVTFPTGARSATVTVPVVDDLVLEGTEKFTVDLSAGDGLTVSSRSVDVPLADND